MKKFIKDSFYFALPIIFIFFLVILIYFICDPFKVIKKYDVYYEPSSHGCIEVNKGYLSFMNFNSHMKTFEYNSYIFGSSRSMFYQVEDWEKYLADNDSCYHFDASSENLLGMYEKVKYVHNSGVDLKNVLFVIDYSIFEERMETTHLNIIPPQLVRNSNFLQFHLSFIDVFLNLKFLIAYFDYSITGNVKPYMNGVLDTKPFYYDYITNEVKFLYYEDLIKKEEYYTPERMKSFFKRSEEVNIKASLIDSEEESMLSEIHEIFVNCNTDYKIIISPLYAQVSMSENDLLILYSIFGADNVFNYSGKNEITENYINYYENSHYRPHVASWILDDIYK
ncbi:MAG: hypothetical protein PQJ44_01650 [Sphaerochaetaceae bacterium]|nr:hypothetical protein [Sphaerochaetaceae bacterium]